MESPSCHCCPNESADLLLHVYITVEFSLTVFVSHKLLHQRLNGQLDICDVFPKFTSDKSSFLGRDLYMHLVPVPVPWNVICFASITTV